MYKHGMVSMTNSQMLLDAETLEMLLLIAGIEPHPGPSGPKINENDMAGPKVGGGGNVTRPNGSQSGIAKWFGKSGTRTQNQKIAARDAAHAMIKGFGKEDIQV